MMTYTYIVYYALVIICFILGIYGSKNNICGWLAKFGICSLYSIVAGFKYSVGDDFLGYLEFYQNVYNGVDYEIYFDTGYVVLNKILAALRVPPVGFFIFLNFINITSVIYLTQKACPKALPYALALFIMMDYGFSLSTNIYRQYFAVSCFAFVLPFALRKNKIPFIIGCLLVAQFHASAAICLLYLFFVKKDVITINNRLAIITIILILYFIGNYIFPLFISMFQSIANMIGMGDRSYLDNGFRVELGGGLGITLKIIQTALVIWFYPVITRKNKNKVLGLVLNGYVFGNFIKPLFFTDIVLLRTLLPFIVYEYLAVGMTISYCIRRKNYFLIGLFLILSYIVLFYSYISGSINWMSPYLIFPDNYG